MGFIDELMGGAASMKTAGGYTNDLPTYPGTPLPPATPAPPPAPTTPTYDAKNPPPGFTAQQWARLLKMAKKNPKIADLIKKYTATAGQPSEEDKWRRVMPTDTSQLLRQLSYNAGEIGMPGGYVGAVQLPAYGETQPPVNNPDMSKYGQGKGLGEATFYQQSMNGGMAPIAAMSPIGVPEGWKPGGTSTKDELTSYLDKINGAGGGGGGGGGGRKNPYAGMSPGDAVKMAAKNQAKAVARNPGSFGGAMPLLMAFMQAKRGGGAGGGKGGGGVTNDKPPLESGKPTSGVPISLPFGF